MHPRMARSTQADKVRQTMRIRTAAPSTMMDLLTLTVALIDDAALAPSRAPLKHLRAPLGVHGVARPATVRL